MIKIIHRVNTINQLNTIPQEYGVEIDIRGYGPNLLLNHEPIDDPTKHDSLENYLQNFHHSFIIFNTKEAGYEQTIIDLAHKYNIDNFFFLDVEFPFLYKASRVNHFRKIAIRYSEAEPIEFVESQTMLGRSLVDWVWIDTNTILPLNTNVVDRLKRFKTCLVCPSRWGRPQDIPNYIQQMKDLNFKLDAVMTSLEHINQYP